MKSAQFIHTKFLEKFIPNNISHYDESNNRHKNIFNSKSDELEFKDKNNKFINSFIGTIYEEMSIFDTLDDTVETIDFPSLFDDKIKKENEYPINISALTLQSKSEYKLPSIIAMIPKQMLLTNKVERNLHSTNITKTDIRIINYDNSGANSSLSPIKVRKFFEHTEDSKGLTSRPYIKLNKRDIRLTTKINIKEIFAGTLKSFSIKHSNHHMAQLSSKKYTLNDVVVPFKVSAAILNKRKYSKKNSAIVNSLIYQKMKF